MEPNRTWNPGHQALTFSNCPYPAHLGTDIGEDTMFSCCLPVTRGRGLKRGSDESRFRRGRRWTWTPPRHLWPFSRRDLESSTQNKEDRQLANEDPHPMSTNEGQVSLTMEGQSRPEVSVATWAAGDPGLVDGRGRRIPPPKPPRLHRPQPIPKPPSLHRPPTPPCPKMDRQLKVFNCNWELGDDVKWTRPDDLEPKEAEPRAPAQGAEPAVVRPREPDAETDPKGCPVPEALPPPAAAAAEALEPGPAWAASPDLAEAPPPLAEGPCPEPALVPASGEELPQDHPPGPTPELLVEGAQPDASEAFALPPLTDLFLLFSFVLMFIFSPWRDSVFTFFTFMMWGLWGSLLLSFSFFFFLAFIFPWHNSCSLIK
uniref:Uncharacterized protein n=1 Tax=Molossus molossus TaxID=27622 RepID=A0A7J8EFF9_MOLMO|nr:hypothetical protein HJG59_008938 [Molossus molossus]